MKNVKIFLPIVFLALFSVSSPALAGHNQKGKPFSGFGNSGRVQKPSFGNSGRTRKPKFDNAGRHCADGGKGCPFIFEGRNSSKRIRILPRREETVERYFPKGDDNTPPDVIIIDGEEYRRAD